MAHIPKDDLMPDYRDAFTCASDFRSDNDARDAWANDTTDTSYQIQMAGSGMVAAGSLAQFDETCEFGTCTTDRGYVYRDAQPFYGPMGKLWHRFTLTNNNS